MLRCEQAGCWWRCSRTASPWPRVRCSTGAGRAAMAASRARRSPSSCPSRASSCRPPGGPRHCCCSPHLLCAPRNCTAAARLVRSGADSCQHSALGGHLLPWPPRQEHSASWAQLGSTGRGGVPFMKQSSHLQHCQRGTVSVSFDGTECCIAFERARILDATHQVRLGPAAPGRRTCRLARVPRLGTHALQPPGCCTQHSYPGTHGRQLVFQITVLLVIACLHALRAASGSTACLHAALRL